MSQDQLSTVFFALADPTRRGVLARLATGDATVKELAEPYDMSVAAVSKHLKVLEAAGLVSQGRQSQWRPRHLEAGPLQEVFEWPPGYPRLWGRSPHKPPGPPPRPPHPKNPKKTGRCTPPRP